MVTIKTSCPACGSIELAPDEILLVVCDRDEWSYYSFTCPLCREVYRKAADLEVQMLLVSGGITPTHWHIPAEALEEHQGAPISYDEVLDFGLEIEAVNMVAAFAGAWS